MTEMVSLILRTKLQQMQRSVEMLTWMVATIVPVDSTTLQMMVSIVTGMEYVTSMTVT